MKKKVSELSGAQLDWAVELAKGTPLNSGMFVFRRYHKDGSVISEYFDDKPEWSYSTSWSQGGPIIERENISILCAEGNYCESKAGTPDAYETYWVAEIGRLCPDTVYGSQGDNWGEYFQVEESAISGPTPLIAALRCYVASKLGGEVEIPEALI